MAIKYTLKKSEFVRGGCEWILQVILSGNGKYSFVYLNNI